MRVFLVLGLVACGPGLAEPEIPKPRVGVPPATDEAGLRAQLGGDVQNGGLWFTDADCVRFVKPGQVPPDAFDAFARCVAGLRLRPTGRAHWADDATVLTDDAGFEIEARVVAGKLEYIGFSGRGPGMPDLPTITPAALEALRTGGDPRATITDEIAARAIPTKTPWSEPHIEYLRLCIGEGGEITGVRPSTATTIAAANAFASVALTWSFKPFTVADAPIPVCAIVALQYPAGTPEQRLPMPPRFTSGGKTFHNVVPKELEGRRITGKLLIVPSDLDKTRIHQSGKHRLVGIFKLCLNEKGVYDSGNMIKSTGVPGYDARIIRELMKWTYKPFLVDGVAVPVCTAITFIYSQTH